MAKLPFVKFFPRDWMGDERLRLCSLAARGLWIDMLCLMHSAHRRGYLQTATGTPLPLDQLARLTGCSTDEASRLLSELESAGVYDCTEHGMIYSRRMVREEGKREKCSEAGRKGGGNPTFKGQPKGESKGDPKRNPNPSESQRHRSTEEEERPALPPVLDTPEFRHAWDRWLQDRKDRKLKKYTERGEQAALTKLAEWGHVAALESIENSISNQWQGLFQPKQQPKFETHDERTQREMGLIP